MSVDPIAISAPTEIPPEGGRSDSPPEAGTIAPFGDDGFTFADFIDIINPLQHIPLVSTAYRALTGDKIDAGARVLGGGLFGGVVGAVLGLINGAVEHSTGRDLGGHMIAFLRPEPGEAARTAAADPRPGAASGSGRATAAAAARAYAAALAAPELGQVREEWP